MDSNQLTWLLSNNVHTQQYFRGVFSSNTLPFLQSTLEKEHNFYIVNLSPSYAKGSHWIAIYKGADTFSEYYDSYGLPPSSTAFETFLGHTYVYNNIQIQHPYSTVCGQHTLFYIIQRCHGFCLKEITSLFSGSENYLFHDFLVNLSIERYFDIDLDLIDFKFLYEQMKDIDIQSLPINKKGKLLKNSSLPVLDTLHLKSASKKRKR